MNFESLITMGRVADPFNIATMGRVDWLDYVIKGLIEFYSSIQTVMNLQSNLLVLHDIDIESSIQTALDYTSSFGLVDIDSSIQDTLYIKSKLSNYWEPQDIDPTDLPLP